MTLVKCEECGKMISKDAVVCPNCGIKVKDNLFLQVIGTIVGIIFIIGIIGNLIDGSNNSNKSKPVKEETIQNIEYQKVNLLDLRRQLEQNAARAQQQYKGKYVDIQGTLGVIDSDGKYFSINTGDIISQIRCNIRNEQQKHILINKNVGNTVYVKGKITDVGEIMGYSIDVIELK